MSKVVVTKEKLDAIGESIRAKTGSTDKYTLDEMPTAIGSIETGDYDEIYDLLGGGKEPIYKHDIHITFGNGSYLDTTIESSDKTPFTWDTLNTWLIENNHISVGARYDATGTFNSSSGKVDIIGVLSYSNVINHAYGTSATSHNNVQKSSSKVNDVVTRKIGAPATKEEVISKENELIAKANEHTGLSDTNLSDAIEHLIGQDILYPSTVTVNNFVDDQSYPYKYMMVSYNQPDTQYKVIYKGQEYFNGDGLFSGLWIPLNMNEQKQKFDLYIEPVNKINMVATPIVRFIQSNMPLTIGQSIPTDGVRTYNFSRAELHLYVNETEVAFSSSSNSSYIQRVNSNITDKATFDIVVDYPNN